MEIGRGARSTETSVMTSSDLTYFNAVCSQFGPRSGDEMRDARRPSSST